MKTIAIIFCFMISIVFISGSTASVPVENGPVSIFQYLDKNAGCDMPALLAKKGKDKKNKRQDELKKGVGQGKGQGLEHRKNKHDDDERLDDDDAKKKKPKKSKKDKKKKNKD